MKHGKGWTQEKIATLRLISRFCRGAIAPRDQAKVTELLKRGHLEDAKILNRRLRPGCGQDINAIILAGPCDGEVREYTCPGCGNAGTYRAYVEAAA